MNVLFVIANAPDYRENFLRKLASKINLTVVSYKCERINLRPPAERKGYRYVEIDINKLGPFFLLKKRLKIDFSNYDLICVDFSLRHLWRLLIEVLKMFTVLITLKVRKVIF